MSPKFTKYIEKQKEWVKQTLDLNRIVVGLYQQQVVSFLVICDYDEMCTALKFNQQRFLTEGGIMGQKGLFVTDVAADKKYKGHFTQLFNYVVNYATDNNYDYLVLHVSQWRPKVQQLYSNHGFITVSKKNTFTYAANNNEQFYAMRYSLK